MSRTMRASNVNDNKTNSVSSITILEATPSSVHQRKFYEDSEYYTRGISKRRPVKVPSRYNQSNIIRSKITRHNNNDQKKKKKVVQVRISYPVTKKTAISRNRQLNSKINLAADELLDEDPKIPFQHSTSLTTTTTTDIISVTITTSSISSTTTEPIITNYCDICSNKCTGTMCHDCRSEGWMTCGICKNAYMPYGFGSHICTPLF